MQKALTMDSFARAIQGNPHQKRLQTTEAQSTSAPIKWNCRSYAVKSNADANPISAQVTYRRDAPNAQSKTHAAKRVNATHKAPAKTFV